MVRERNANDIPGHVVLKMMVKVKYCEDLENHIIRDVTTEVVERNRTA